MFLFMPVGLHQRPGLKIRRGEPRGGSPPPPPGTTYNKRLKRIWPLLNERPKLFGGCFGGCSMRK
jgi:hypothetical protein